MCIVAPEIAQYSDGIQTLQSETAARKATSKEKEEQLAGQNLPLFEQIKASHLFHLAASSNCTPLHLVAQKNLQRTRHGQQAIFSLPFTREHVTLKIDTWQTSTDLNCQDLWGGSRSMRCWLKIAVLQSASAEDHEAIKCGAQALKKLCRLRTNLSWKEWRATMESQKGTSLQVCNCSSLSEIHVLKLPSLVPCQDTHVFFFLLQLIPEQQSLQPIIMFNSNGKKR